jgi:hypothetical protein
MRQLLYSIYLLYKILYFTLFKIMYVFAMRRAKELCSSAAAAKIVQDAQPARGMDWNWDLCGESHAPEECRLFRDLAPGDCLVVVQRKQLCYLCFGHSDSQPCLSQSLPACPIGGCMRMHNRLLHQALQKEETRAVVIQVEEELEKPEEDEEFYAANFKFLGQIVNECKSKPNIQNKLQNCKLQRYRYHKNAWTIL